MPLSNALRSGLPKLPKLDFSSNPPSLQLDSVAQTGFSYSQFEFDSNTDKIGHGGNAVVYRASVSTSDLVVALKRPFPNRTIDRQAVERMLDEAKKWSRVDAHPYIANVFDWGWDGIPWVAIEYIDGGPLTARIEEYSLTQRLWTAYAVADAVAYASGQHGITHHDLKPQNILLDPSPEGTWDIPKIVDWGLSRELIQHTGSISQATPEYAAPEQFAALMPDTPVGIHTDVYQLGVVCFELLTGEHPNHLGGEVPPPSSIESSIPEVVDSAITQALAHDRGERIDHPVLFREALQNGLKKLVSDQYSGTATATAYSVDETKSTESTDTSEAEDPAELSKQSLESCEDQQSTDSPYSDGEPSPDIQIDAPVLENISAAFGGYLTGEKSGSDVATSELIEFAEEDQDLFTYFHHQSRAIDSLSERITRLTSLLNETREEKETSIEDLEIQLAEAKSEYEQRIDEIESEKEEELEELQQQIKNMSDSDLRATKYDDVDELWQAELEDINAQAEVEEANSENKFEDRKAEIEQEISDIREEFRQRRDTLREDRQDAIDERTKRLDEIEQIHVEFSNDLIAYVQTQSERLAAIFNEMMNIQRQNDSYDRESVEHIINDSQIFKETRIDKPDVEIAASALACVAFHRIEKIEESVTAYKETTDIITNELDEKPVRVGTRWGELTDIYQSMVPNSGDQVENHGIAGLKQRVKTLLEMITGVTFESVDGCRATVEAAVNEHGLGIRSDREIKTNRLW